MDYKEYLDQLLKDAVALAENVTDATKQKANQAKTKLDIKKAEVELDKSYRSLGRLMYQIEKGALKRDDMIVNAAIHDVDEKQKTIDELNESLKAQKASEKGAETVEPKEEAAQEAPAQEAPAEAPKADAPEPQGPEAEKASPEAAGTKGSTDGAEEHEN